MKILIATGIFPPDIGGPATYAAQFAAACPKYGHTAMVVAYRDPKARLRAFSYPVVFVSRAYPSFVRHAVFFFACLRAGYSADILFAQGTVSAGFPAACAAFLLRKRLIVRVAGDFAWEYAMNRKISNYSIEDFQNHRSPSLTVAFVRYIQRRVCQASAQVIVPSVHLRDIVVQWGVLAGKIAVVRNAIMDDDAPRATQRPPFSHTVLSAGRMVPWKGFTSLIRVFGVLSPEFTDARLIIAGDGPCRGDIVREAGARGISGRVSILSAVPRGHMAALYGTASCFVLFSDYEGMPHAVLEALSHQVPVIASDTGGTREIISPGVNGMLVPRGDERALQGALAAFLRNPEKEVPFPGFIAGKDITHDSMMKNIFASMERIA